MEGKAALFKRFAGVDAWPVCLDTQDTDEIVEIVRGDRPGLRRHQPRGHRRAALLRDRGAAARAARHPGLPRRPARHRDRGAGRADQRAAGGRQASSTDVRVVVSGAGAAGTAIITAAARARASATSSPATGAGALHRGHDRPRRAPGSGSPSTPTRDGCAGDLPERARAAPTCSSGSPRPNLLDRRRHRHDGRRTRSSSRWPTPTRRSTRARPREHAAVVATGRSRLPEPDQQRARLPRRLPRPARRAGAAEITDEMLLAAARAIADVVGEDKLNPTRHRAQRLRPRVAPAVAAAVRAAAERAPPRPPTRPRRPSPDRRRRQRHPQAAPASSARVGGHGRQASVIGSARVSATGAGLSGVQPSGRRGRSPWRR